MRKIRALNLLLGKEVTLFCGNYIYTGILSDVSPRGATLKDAAIVYETGDFDSPEWKDAQKLNSDWNISVSKIESWGVLTKKFPVQK